MKLNLASHLFSIFVKVMVAATLGENLGPPVPNWSNGQ